MDLDTHAAALAVCLRAHGTLTQVVGEDWDARELFDRVRALVPCVGVISRTGRTLMLGLVTEDARALSHNDRINLATHFGYVRRALTSEQPDRVWF